LSRDDTPDKNILRDQVESQHQCQRAADADGACADGGVDETGHKQLDDLVQQ